VVVDFVWLKAVVVAKWDWHFVSAFWSWAVTSSLDERAAARPGLALELSRSTLGIELLCPPLTS
jgi:hypothetical protein